MRIVTDVFAFCKSQVPKWNTISIRLSHPRSRSDAVQEIAFTLADGIAYVQAALDAGLRVDDFAPRLAFFFNVHNNFLEVAKFRAAPTLGAHHEGKVRSQGPALLALRFHSQTAGSTWWRSSRSST